VPADPGLTQPPLASLDSETRVADEDDETGIVDEDAAEIQCNCFIYLFIILFFFFRSIVQNQKILTSNSMK